MHLNTSIELPAHRFQKDTLEFKARCYQPSKSISSTLCCPLAYIPSLIFQICTTLSSAALAIYQSMPSPKAQATSVGVVVCPPCTNNSSGGPSSASSGVCSRPMEAKSQIATRLSEDAEAKIVSCVGDHDTFNISSLWKKKL